jgi:hypothetical protein
MRYMHARLAEVLIPDRNDSNDTLFRLVLYKKKNTYFKGKVLFFTLTNKYNCHYCQELRNIHAGLAGNHDTN